jgi:hypothetical protein
MSVKVSIEFIGLCLFVRHSATRTYVLVPLTHDDATHGHEKHVLWLLPGAGSAHEVLESLDVDPIGRIGLGSKPLPKQVPNVTGIAKRKVRKELLQQDVPAGKLFARFTLEGGTFVVGESAEWNFAGTSCCTTNAITWTGEHTDLVDPNGTSLTLSGRRMDTAATRRIGPYASDSLGRVRLTVASLPPSEIKKPVRPPKPGEKALHFGAFYSLFEAGNDVIPTFVAEDCSSGSRDAFGTEQTPEPKSTTAKTGIMPVTCMVGGGDGEGG